MARRRKSLSGEDERLWRHATRDVQPLPAPRLVPADVPPRPRARFPLSPSAPSMPSAPSTPSTPSAAPLVDQAPNRQWGRKLRRGDMTIDARLDLHGQTERQAHARLMRFIVEAAATDARRLLVITGKGHAGQGVLKMRLPHWLGEGALRPLVMAIHPAHDKDGGGGAFYVILRRRRP